jgi:alpha-1,3-glucosyltransferase
MLLRGRLWLLCLSSVLLRALLASGPHSGLGAPHGGDYEAQRHWAEVAAAQPLSRWYTAELEYWGPDYPPLSMYWAAATAAAARAALPSLVAWRASLGAAS